VYTIQIPKVISKMTIGKINQDFKKTIRDFKNPYLPVLTAYAFDAQAHAQVSGGLYSGEMQTSIHSETQSQIKMGRERKKKRMGGGEGEGRRHSTRVLVGCTCKCRSAMAHLPRISASAAVHWLI